MMLLAQGHLANDEARIQTWVDLISNHHAIVFFGITHFSDVYCNIMRCSNKAF